MKTYECHHKKLAWYLPNSGEPLSFHELPPDNRDWIQISLDCGHCWVCKLKRSMQYAIRADLESQCWKEGCFLTLTYSNENLPDGGNLSREDITLFIKRLRIAVQRKGGYVSAYFGSAEYGSKRGRAHYHLLLFNWKPEDLQYFGKSYSGMPIYTSSFVSKLWNKGLVWVGSLTGSSGAYVARYTTKKQKPHLVGNRVKPFLLYSSNIRSGNYRGGIGVSWFSRYWQQLEKGYIVYKGFRVDIPSYFIDLLKKYHPEAYQRILANKVASSLSKPLSLDFVKNCIPRLKILVYTADKVLLGFSDEDFNLFQRALESFNGVPENTKSFTWLFDSARQIIFDNDKLLLERYFKFKRNL